MESQEKNNIEWKSVWKDEYLVGICAFANAQGGKFFIGIDDNGKIIGVENSSGPKESGPKCSFQTRKLKIVFNRSRGKIKSLAL